MVLLISALNYFWMKNIVARWSKWYDNDWFAEIFLVLSAVVAVLIILIFILLDFLLFL